MDKMASTSHLVDADTPVSQPDSSTATNQSEASAADVDTADTSSSESAFLLSLYVPALSSTVFSFFKQNNRYISVNNG